jgi:hypothetical protein
MPVEFHWDNGEQTLLCFVTRDPWNWNDFHKAMRRATFTLDTVDHPVEILVDFRQSNRLPAGALGHIRSLGKAIHPNTHNRLLIVGLDDSMAGLLGGDDGRYSDGTRLLCFAHSEDEAQAILKAWLSE